MATASILTTNPNGAPLPNVGTVRIIKAESYVPHGSYDVQLRRNANLKITNSLIFKSSELVDVWPSDAATAQFTYLDIANQSRAMHGNLDHLEKAYNIASYDYGFSNPQTGFLTLDFSPAPGWSMNFPVSHTHAGGYYYCFAYVNKETGVINQLDPTDYANPLFLGGKMVLSGGWGSSSVFGYTWTVPVKGISNYRGARLELFVPGSYDVNGAPIGAQDFFDIAVSGGVGSLRRGQQLPFYWSDSSGTSFQDVLESYFTACECRACYPDDCNIEVTCMPPALHSHDYRHVPNAGQSNACPLELTYKGWNYVRSSYCTEGGTETWGLGWTNSGCATGTSTSQRGASFWLAPTGTSTVLTQRTNPWLWKGVNEFDDVFDLASQKSTSGFSVYNNAVMRSVGQIQGWSFPSWAEAYKPTTPNYGPYNVWGGTTTPGNGISWGAGNIFAMGGLQKNHQIDLAYQTYTYDPTQLANFSSPSQLNPNAQSIYESWQTYESTNNPNDVWKKIHWKNISKTHCGIKLTIKGALYTPPNQAIKINNTDGSPKECINMSFDFDTEVYVKITRHKGWDANINSMTSPDINGYYTDSNGIRHANYAVGGENWGALSNPTSRCENGKVVCTLPGETYDMGMDWTDEATSANFYTTGFSGKPMGDFKNAEGDYVFDIPLQPQGDWLYVAHFYTYNKTGSTDFEVTDEAGVTTTVAYPEKNDGDKVTLWSNVSSSRAVWGVNILDNCGYCATDSTYSDECIRREWQVPGDQIDYWEDVESTGSLFATDTDANGVSFYPNRKYIWGGFDSATINTLNHGYESAAPGARPTIGDIVNTYKGLHYVKCNNSLVVKGGSPVATGPTVTYFQAFYGPGHDNNVDWTGLNKDFYDIQGIAVDKSNGLSSHTISGQSAGLGDGDITFPFDACNFPYEGEYKLKYTVVCADTGFEQFSREVNIYVDKSAPFSLDTAHPGDDDSTQNTSFLSILEEGSNTLTYNFEVDDTIGVACVVVSPVELYPSELEPNFDTDNNTGICLPSNLYNCDNFYVMFGGDKKDGTHFSNGETISSYGGTVAQVSDSSDTSKMIIQRQRVLTESELSSCVCNGTHRLNILAMDYAGNCHYFYYMATIQGSTRGKKAGGLCKPNPSTTPSQVLGWKDSDGYYYSEKLCCIESGGYYNNTTKTCIEFGDNDESTKIPSGTCSDGTFIGKNACLCGTNGIWDPTTNSCVEGSLLPQGTCSDVSIANKIDCNAIGTCDDGTSTSQQLCCSNNGGTFNSETGVCIGGTGTWSPSNTWTPFAWTYGEQWEFSKGLCVDCYDNAIGDPASGAAWDNGAGVGDYFTHVNEQACIAVTDPICTCKRLSWWHNLSGDADLEGQSCNEIFTENHIDIPVGGMISPNSPTWGWSIKINLSNFLKEHGCWGSGDCSEFPNTGFPHEPTGGWNYEFLTGVNLTVGCFPAGAITTDVTSPYVEHGQVFVSINAIVQNWETFNRYCGKNIGCAVSMTVPQLMEGCCTIKAAGTGQLHFSVPLFLDGQCCECCSSNFSNQLEEITATGMTSNATLQYNIADDRWDVQTLGEEYAGVENDLSLGGVTTGKFGEQIVYQGGELKSIAKNKKLTKPWVYHSKDYTMSVDSQDKRFKSIKVLANYKFNSTPYSSIPNDASVIPIGSYGIYALVDGLVVPIKRTDKITDMDNMIAGETGEEKQFHTYEFEIDRKYQKGKSIAIRMQNQTDNSIVESFSFVYRVKPVK